MRRLAVAFAALSLAAVPALAAQGFTVGAAVFDSSARPVGTIIAVEGNAVVTVRTDKYAVRMPAGSFLRQSGKFYIALSREQLNAKHESDQAAIAASLLPGKPVKGLQGQLLGTIESIDQAEVTIRLTDGQSIRMPRSGVSGRVDDAAVAGITAEEIEAQLKGSTNNN